MRPILVTIPMLLLCASCVVSEEYRGPDEVPAIRSTQPERMWNVLFRGEEVGSVVLYESESSSFFSVRNEWNQDLGLIDEMGRAWAYRPHREEAEWLGSGSVVSGACRILGLEGTGELVEVPLDSLSPPEDPLSPPEIVTPQVDRD